MKQLSDDEIIAALRQVDVPEPSPLFWNHLSQRVREAVANEPAPAPGWINRLNVAWAAGVFGAVAVVVLAVVVTVHRGGRHEVDSVPAAVTNGVAQVNDALPTLQDDASWAVMGDLASQLNLEDAAAAGLIATPGSAEQAVGQLSQDEQQAAVELLQQAIRNSRQPKRL